MWVTGSFFQILTINDFIAGDFSCDLCNKRSGNSVCGTRPARDGVSMAAGGGSEGATATLETVKSLSDKVHELLLFAVMVRIRTRRLP